MILYFLPGETGTANTELLAKHGLQYAFDGSCTSRSCTGPGGQLGLLVARGGSPAYNPDQQEWQQIPGQQAWAGVDCDHPPGPQDLARAHQFPGKWIVLGDENPWHIPRAMEWYQGASGNIAYAPELPYRLRLGPDGTWHRGTVVPKYRQLWDLALKYAERFISGPDSDKGDGSINLNIDYIEALGLIITALQANYHIGAVEASLLGLIAPNSGAIPDALFAIVDWHGFIDLAQKKTSSASASTRNGELALASHQA